MINIIEKQTSKVPGLTSLFVSFDYNKQIIDEIKKLPCFNYSQKTRQWEIPIRYTAELIDSLCTIDDISLSFCDISIAPDEKFDLMEYKTKPFEYQLDGIQFGLNHDKWLLLDVPGLGKTLQIMYIAQELKERKGIDHCLVVCGINSLKTNWKKEIKKHTNLSCRVLGEKVSKNGNVSYKSIDERLKELNSKISEFFVITNIETLRDDRIVKAINNNKSNKFEMIVIDEAHTCRNQSSKQGGNLLKLTNAYYKIAATGTLLLKDPMDLYVPLKWIDAERSTKTNFEDYYYNYGGLFGNEFIGYKNLDTLQTQLKLYSLRRHKDLLDLPPKTIVNEYVDMNDKHKKFYDDIKNGVIEDVDKVKLDMDATLGMVLRLRQATACPSILTSCDVPSSKIDRACELVEEITSSGGKVVIFSTFKQTVDELNKKLKEYSPLIGTGDTPDDVLSTSIDEFQTNDFNKVFIGTWQKCGTGITLNRASYMIFIDTPWTDGVYQQACDRIHRIGSKNAVTIYNLICSNTIDEKVLEIVETKASIADYVVDNQLTKSAFKSLQKYIQELSGGAQ